MTEGGRGRIKYSHCSRDGSTRWAQAGVILEERRRASCPQRRRLMIKVKSTPGKADTYQRCLQTVGWKKGGGGSRTGFELSQCVGRQEQMAERQNQSLTLGRHAK